MSSASQYTAVVSNEKTKSLNIVARKKENERIERENHGLAKRLFENGGAISKKTLDKEYQQIAQYKKMIQRTKPKKPVFQGRFSSLPPLRRGSVQLNTSASK